MFESYSDVTFSTRVALQYKMRYFQCKKLGSVVLSVLSTFIFISTCLLASEKNQAIVLDIELPRIIHYPYTRSIIPDKPLQIQAIISDNAVITSVTLFYRTQQGKNYKARPLQPSTDIQNTYTTFIPINELISDKIEYYIQATDGGGNTAMQGGSQSPLTIIVTRINP